MKYSVYNQASPMEDEIILRVAQALVKSTKQDKSLFDLQTRAGQSLELLEEILTNHLKHPESDTLLKAMASIIENYESAIDTKKAAGDRDDDTCAIMSPFVETMNIGMFSKDSSIADPSLPTGMIDENSVFS